MNIVMLKGSLARAPEVRELATGEQVVGYEVIVLRDGERAETVPVVRNGSAAVAASAGWSAGHEVVVVGRVRRRFFRAGGVTQSRTEVVADAVVTGSERRKVRTAVGRALEGVDGLGPRPHRG